MLITKSILLFIVAGLCEIGGGYLIWLWLREGKGIIVAVATEFAIGNLGHQAAETCFFHGPILPNPPAFINLG